MKKITKSILSIFCTIGLHRWVHAKPVMWVTYELPNYVESEERQYRTCSVCGKTDFRYMGRRTEDFS